ncbi:MAG: trigger factor [Eubacterium sp.]
METERKHAARVRPMREMENMSEIKVTKLGEYKGVEVPKTEITVSEQELQDELERARTYAGKQIDKGDAPAETGDTVQIDFVGTFDGEPFEGGSGENYPLTLGSGQFIPGFEEQLVGAKKDDQVDVTVNFPENYHDASCAGRPAVFHVTVHKVTAVELPELTDEVVKQISGMDTLEEFKKYVHSEITRAKEQEASTEKESRILEKILENSEVAIPAEEIDQRAAVLKQSLEGNLKNNGSTMEDYLGYNNITMEEFDKFNRIDAESMLKGQAVLGEIAKRENLTCSPEELEEAMSSMAQQYGMPLEQLKGMIGEEGPQLIQQDVVSQKALHFIHANAKEV